MNAKQTKKTAYHNAEPTGENVPVGMPKDAIRREFAKRLQGRMLEKGWNQSELARRAQEKMPNGRFGRDSISGYIRGFALPGPIHLAALCAALDVLPTELLPVEMVPSVDKRLPSLDVTDVGNGQAYVKINKTVTWDQALKIMQLLKAEGGE